jgi:hypothetical protein
VVQGSSTDVALDADGSPRPRRQVAVMHKEEEQWLEEGQQKQSATDTGVDDLALTSNWMRPYQVGDYFRWRRSSAATSASPELQPG